MIVKLKCNNGFECTYNNANILHVIASSPMLILQPPTTNHRLRPVLLLTHVLDNTLDVLLHIGEVCPELEFHD